MCFETTHELLSGPTIRTAGRARHGRGISGALRAATRRSAERYPGARVRLRAGARGPPARLVARSRRGPTRPTLLASRRPFACQTRRPSSPRMRSLARGRRSPEESEKNARSLPRGDPPLSRAAGGTTWRTKGRDATRTRVPDRSPAILRSSQQRRPQPAVSGRRQCTTAPVPLRVSFCLYRARAGSLAYSRHARHTRGVTHPGVLVLFPAEFAWERVGFQREDRLVVVVARVFERVCRVLCLSLSFSREVRFAAF